MKQWYFLLFILWRLSVAKSYIRLYNIENREQNVEKSIGGL